MSPREIEKVVYNVECFFNAARAPDSRQRTEAEEKTVQWLLSDQSRQAYAIYHERKVFLYDQTGAVRKSLALPEAEGSHTVWCNGKKISALDSHQFALGKVVLIGTALMLTMPGMVAAQDSKFSFGFGTEINSNNNNNNNNNNG